MPEICASPSLSPATHEQSSWLPRRRRSAGAARQLLREFLAAHPERSERLAEVGELLLSELVANAVEHPRVPPGRLILVRFTLCAAELRIEVHDAGEGLPAAPTTAEPPDHDAESGRGLFLVEHLSHRWGCLPRPDGVGKSVWCTVTADDRSAAA